MAGTVRPKWVTSGGYFGAEENGAGRNMCATKDNNVDPWNLKNWGGRASLIISAIRTLNQTVKIHDVHLYKNVVNVCLPKR